MAPSKPATADNVINERRLRPIYDWLDNGNNKKALQEAEKVLKKQPSLHCAKVLKALALIRLGKSEDAQLLLADVLALEPCDDATLQAMTICFRETHHPELTCQAYEAAVKKDPNNEEFLSHLFMGYVRLGDYRKQQKTALALFKAKPKNPYYFWAVMSIVMQAYGNDDDDKVCLSVTLPLAERMIKKFVDENKIEAEAEVQLYLMILEKEGKFMEALQVINGPLAGKLASGVAQTKRGDYLRQLKMWPQVLDHFECLLRQQPDQWLFYVNYFEAMFHLCSGDGSGDLKSSVDRAVSLLDCLQSELSGARERIRGPYLARLYLWQQLHERQLDAAALLLSGGRALLESYVSLLGDKPCAFQDLRLFARSLLNDGDEQEVDLFLKFCAAEAGGGGDVSAVLTVKQLCRHLLHAQLTFFLGGHTRSGGDKVQAAAQLWSHYLATKSLNSGLLATDFRPNDNYALMAAHLLLDAWKESGATADSALLAKCLLLLETALLESPANYHLKLLAMRVYTVAGYGRAALQRYETLDVKYIQLDSLGHLLCRPLISLGLPSAASPLLSATLRFFTSHAREQTSESLIAAYKYGSFLQIPEFTKLSEKLDHSMHFSAATAERMLLDLLLADASPHSTAGRDRLLVNVAAGMYADPDKDQPSNWSSQVDNRDCSIFISWHPSQELPCDDAMMKKKTFEAEVLFAQLRNRLVHALIAAISISPGWQQATVEEGNVPSPSATAGSKNGSSVFDHQHEANGSSGSSVSHQSARHLVLQRLIDELRRLLLQLQPESFISHSQFCIQSPPPPRLYTYVADKCLEPLLILFDCCVSVFVSSSSCSSSTEATMIGTSNSSSSGVLLDAYEKALSQVIESAQQEPANVGFWRHYVRLERVYNATETICMCVMALSTMYSCVKANSNSGGGAKKKKKQQQQSAESSKDAVELVNGLVERTASILRRLESLLEEMQLMDIFCPNRLVISGDDEGLVDEESERIAQEVRKKTATSSTTDEMKNLLADKRKVLSFLA